MSTKVELQVPLFNWKTILYININDKTILNTITSYLETNSFIRSVTNFIELISQCKFVTYVAVSLSNCLTYLIANIWT